VFPTSLYPEEDLVELIRAMAALLRGAGATPRADGCALVRERGPTRPAEGRPPDLRAPRLDVWQTQHDTGRLVLVDEGAERARYELERFGNLSREMCAVIRGYIPRRAHSGFASVEVAKVGCVLDGRDRCTWACTWREPSA
jgi:hypothetical protein